MGIWKSILKLFNVDRKRRQNINVILPTGRTFEQQKKHDLRKVIEVENNSKNPKFNRTSKEEDLAFNFSFNHSTKLNLLENELYVKVKSVFSTYQIDERIEKCKIAIKAYEDLKKFCLSKGKGGTIHFEDMWEHCHNSKNTDFRFIEKIENELLYLTENYNEADRKLSEELIKIKNRELVNEFKKHAESDILKVILKTPGIIQKDLFLEFDEIYKNTVRNVLKKLESSNTITRTKKGNSYELYYNNSINHTNE